MSVGHSVVAQPGSLGWSRTIWTGVAVAAAAISLVALLATNAGTDDLGWDFRYTYLRAAERVMDGHSPYPPLNDAAIGSGTAYVYPPQLAVALAPLTATVSEDLLVWAAFVAALASLAGALALLGVRDVGCYAAVFAWGATSNALEMTNLSAFLVLALAGVWRYRATVWPLAWILGVAVATKLFLWPLAMWALAMRRYGALVRVVGVGVVVVVSSWAAIGFAGLVRYPDVLGRFAEIQGERHSYSIVAVVVGAGAGAGVGQALAFLAGAALLALTLHFGRSHDDARSFIAAIGAALVLTPVAWLHFYVLLAVPLAISRPRFSAIWLLPIVLWMCPRYDNGGDLQRILPIVVTGIVLTATLSRGTAVFREGALA